MTCSFFYSAFLAALIALPARATEGSTNELEVLRAARDGDIALLSRLIDQGANPNVEDRNGYTPLATAALLGRTEVVRTLLGKKADANVGKYPPLTAAAGGKHPDQARLVQLLLDSGAIVDKPRYDGLTALHLAVMHGHTDVVRVLLFSGANVNQPSPQGSTALDWAILLRRNDVKDLLKSYNAGTGCGRPLGNKGVTNDFTSFLLYAFVPFALVVFLLSAYLKPRTGRTVSPLALSYGIPIVVFFGFQIRYICGSDVQLEFIHAAPAIAALLLQAIAFFGDRPKLSTPIRVATAYGLVTTVLPTYGLLLLLMFTGAH